jgi:hypothetical protein
MKKLEAQISKAVVEFYEKPTVCASMETNFGYGARYVLCLDLPIKFAEWKEKEVRPFAATNNIDGLYILSENANVNRIFETTKELYEYWLNNVYDGK